MGIEHERLARLEQLPGRMLGPMDRPARTDPEVDPLIGTRLTADWLPGGARPAWMPEAKAPPQFPMFGQGDYWFQRVGASPDGRFVPVPHGHTIRMIDLWGVLRIGPVYPIVRDGEMIVRLEFMPDRQMLLACTRQMNTDYGTLTVYLYDLRREEEVLRLEDIQGAAINPVTKEAVLFHADNVLRVDSTGTLVGELAYVTPEHLDIDDYEGMNGTISPDGRFYVSHAQFVRLGILQSTLVGFDISDGRHAHMLSLHAGMEEYDLHIAYAATALFLPYRFTRELGRPANENQFILSDGYADDIPTLRVTENGISEADHLWERFEGNRGSAYLTATAPLDGHVVTLRREPRQFVLHSVREPGQAERWHRAMIGTWDVDDMSDPTLILAGDVLVMLIYDVDQDTIHVRFLNAHTGTPYDGDPTKLVPQTT